jgi:AraC-like DNA-binding protein
MGLRQWRTQLRIHHALVLLAHDHSVTRTAVASGWANPSAFIEAFTQTVGQTPGCYASELRKRPSPDDADRPPGSTGG